MRCCSASKSRVLPSRSATTISPSITARGREVRQHRLDDLGEVAGHRPFVAAADLHLVAVAEDDRPESVPLGLVELVRPGSSLTGLASMGETGGMTGSCTASVSFPGLLPAAGSGSGATAVRVRRRELAAGGGDLAATGVPDCAGHSGCARTRATNSVLRGLRAGVPFAARRGVQRDEVDVHQLRLGARAVACRAGRPATAGR